MMIGIIGESCAGKSTLAETLKTALGAEVVTGKDYLRMAKSENEATALFRGKPANAVSGGSVISEPEHEKLLPEGAVRVLVTADLGTIKERFHARMRGNLPAPVAAMPERKHGLFEYGTYDFRFDGVNGDAAALAEALHTRAAAE